jgi:hypothetical protein
MLFGLTGLIIFILDIYVIIQIIKAGGDPAKQLLWILVVLLLPLVGPLLYFLVGPGSQKI